MKTIHVAAAVIREGEKLFTCARGYGPQKGGWEFPGGKIEPGETPEQAVVREIREELAVQIRPERYLMTVKYDYPEFHLVMECFLCTIQSGQIHLLEAQESRWLALSELGSVPWLPADAELINRLPELLKQ